MSSVLLIIILWRHLASVCCLSEQVLTSQSTLYHGTITKILTHTHIHLGGLHVRLALWGVQWWALWGVHTDRETGKYVISTAWRCVCYGQWLCGIHCFTMSWWWPLPGRSTCPILHKGAWQLKGVPTDNDLKYKTATHLNTRFTKYTFYSVLRTKRKGRSFVTRLFSLCSARAFIWTFEQGMYLQISSAFRSLCIRPFRMSSTEVVDWSNDCSKDLLLSSWAEAGQLDAHTTIELPHRSRALRPPVADDPTSNDQTLSTDSGGGEAVPTEGGDALWTLVRARRTLDCSSRLKRLPAIMKTKCNALIATRCTLSSSSYE